MESIIVILHVGKLLKRSTFEKLKNVGSALSQYFFYLWQNTTSEIMKYDSLIRPFKIKIF